MLASEYGWAKRQILEDVYFDELFDLKKSIESRQTAEYRIQASIIQSVGWENPAEIFDIFGGKATKPHDGKKEYWEVTEFNPIEMDKLRVAMSDNPRFIVK